MGTGPPARRRLPVHRRREELLAAALELFARRPSHEVSIDDVAAAAGASRALVYHYFGNKRELYVAALRKAAADLSERLAPPEQDSPRERLAVAVASYFDFAEEHAAGFAALLRGGPPYRDDEVGAVVDQVRRTVLDRLVEGLGLAEATGVLRATLRAWIAAAETAALDWLEHRDVDRAILEGALVDQLAAMLEVAAVYDSISAGPRPD